MSHIIADAALGLLIVMCIGITVLNLTRGGKL